MAFYHLPNPWNPHYAIPDYVMAEPPGRGTFTTKQMPRGTIQQIVPDFLAKPVASKNGLGSLGGSTLAGDTLGVRGPRLGTLAGDTLGAQRYELEALGQNPIAPGAPGDPILGFGRKGADWILLHLRGVPGGERDAALRALLDAVEPGLWARYNALLRQYGGAQRRAIAATLAEGLARDIVETGKRAMRGNSNAVSPDSLLGLGVHPEGRGRAAMRAAALGGLWDTIKGVGSGLWGGVSSIARLPGQAIGTTGKFVGQGLEKLGALACAVVSSPLGSAAGAGASSAAGAGPQAGAAGASVAAQMCAKPLPPAMPYPPPPSTPSWVVPAAIGGGLLAVVLLLR